MFSKVQNIPRFLRKFGSEWILKSTILNQWIGKLINNSIGDSMNGWMKR